MLMKMTLSIIMLIMKYQGDKGKYYTLQKASVLISGFFSLFASGIIRKVFNLDKNQLLVLFVFVWFVFFLGHYIWFLNQDFSKARLHYKEFIRYMFIFSVLMIMSFLLFVI